jgi:hypothetical protein
LILPVSDPVSCWIWRFPKIGEVQHSSYRLTNFAKIEKNKPMGAENGFQK